MKHRPLEFHHPNPQIKNQGSFRVLFLPVNLVPMVERATACNRLTGSQSKILKYHLEITMLYIAIDLTWAPFY